VHVERITVPHTSFPNADPGMTAAELVAQTMLWFMPSQTLPEDKLRPESIVERVEFCEKHALPRVLKNWPKPFDFWKLVQLYDAAFEHAARLRSRMKQPSHEWVSEEKWVLLVIWAACMSAAKTIAYKTRSGRNTPETRAKLFKAMDAAAKRSTLYRAGVEAAPLFKKRRGQRVYFDGVPAWSPVRRYA
jgi:hypothetical protein